MLSSSVLLALLAAPLVSVLYGCVIVLKYLAKKRKIAAAVNRLPGPPKEFFFGNLRTIPKDGEGRLNLQLENVKKFKTAYSIQIGPFTHIVNLVSTANVKKLLKTAEPKQSADKFGYTLLLEWLGKGLLINNGSGWFRNRRLLTPAFHFDVLKPYVKVYNEASGLFLENISKELNGNAKAGGVVEVFRLVGLCTLNVMLRCAFSSTDDIQRQGDTNTYVKTVGQLSQLVFKRFFNPLMYFDTLYQFTGQGKLWKSGCEYAHEVAYDLIQKRRVELGKDGTAESIKSKRAVDFLDILLLARDENGEGLTDLEIRSEVDTFLFEGHDTTASAISWTLYLLAAHPEYQSKAREEVNHLLDGRDSDYLQWDDLNRIPYLTMCIKESMRHTPPVPVFGRELENPMEIDGVMLEPGTFLNVSPFNVHHNPLVWGEDHMEYKPDRFLHENMKNMDSHAFIPFSAGPRNCIGQNFAMNEIKTIMARVLHKFILDVDPSNVPKKSSILVMRSDNGVHVKFTPRCM